MGIAVRLMKLAAAGACERVLVVSGDTDLVPAISEARATWPARIGGPSRREGPMLSCGLSPTGRSTLMPAPMPVTSSRASSRLRTAPRSAGPAAGSGYTSRAPSDCTNVLSAAERPPWTAVVILERYAGRRQSRHMPRPEHIVTAAPPKPACAAASARYTVGNLPRRPGPPAQAGLFFARSGGVREWPGGSAGHRLLGLPERLSPRARCILSSRRGRKGRPGRSTGPRASARGPCLRQLPRRCASLSRAPQRASRSAVLRRISPTDRQAGQPRGWACDGRRARPPLSARLAETSRPGEGHRRGTRRRLRHDGRPK